MWFLSPSGWPTFADSPEEQADLIGAGYVLITESQVQPAIDAYHAGSPPPPVPDFALADASVLNVRKGPYNAKGDGATDDTAAIQAALDACPDGGTVYLPIGLYKLSAALVTGHKNMRIIGAGVHQVFRTLTEGTSFDVPTTAPWLRGTVLLQTAAGANAITINASAKRVDVCDLGVRFDDPIRHVNTGHGIYSVPDQTYAGGHDHGTFNGEFRNIAVFGHDGNHYGFYTVNQLLYRWDHLFSYGGGGFYVGCDSFAGNYGNLTATDTYTEVYCGGSAHGYALEGRAVGSNGLLNLIAWVRPQAVVESDNASLFPETITPPTDAQKLWAHLNFFVSHVTILAPDFESWGIGSTCDFTTSGGLWVDPSGIYGGPVGAYGTFTQVIGKSAASPLSGQSKALYSDMSLRGSVGPAPALAAGANAGTSPPAPVGQSDNSDERGVMTFGTGTAPTAGRLAQYNWAEYKGTSPVRIMLTPTNAATAQLGIYVEHDGGSVYVCAANAPAADQADTTYGVEWSVTF